MRIMIIVILLFDGFIFSEVSLGFSLRRMIIMMTRSKNFIVKRKRKCLNGMTLQHMLV